MMAMKMSVIIVARNTSRPETPVRALRRLRRRSNGGESHATAMGSMRANGCNAKTMHVRGPKSATSRSRSVSTTRSQIVHSARTAESRGPCGPEPRRDDVGRFVPPAIGSREALDYFTGTRRPLIWTR